MAKNTLRGLSDRQSRIRDDFHDQEPGKILYELRFGELTAIGQQHHSPYYGTADATPLFVILLDEYHRWTGDDALVRGLAANARAALEWIEHSGEADGDGYVEYARRNAATGLVNQCWKDSWDAIQFADGTLADGPIATCEIQGYVYDARCRGARLAREVWGDPALAERLETLASGLRDCFRRDYWMPDQGCYALALDGDKAPGRQPDLEDRSRSRVRAGRRRAGEHDRRPSAGRASVLGLGGPRARHGGDGLQPPRATTPCPPSGRTRTR